MIRNPRPEPEKKAPTKKTVAETQAQEEYEGLMVGLNEARAKLKEVEDKLEAMQNKKAQRGVT